MLVELGLVEQRFQAVLEVLNDGASVTDVARRYGVARQTVHEWLRRYAAEGVGGLADHSSRPLSCPHQMAHDDPLAAGVTDDDIGLVPVGEWRVVGALVLHEHLRPAAPG